MPISCNIGGVSHNAKPFVNINGIWHPVKKAFANAGGVWKQSYSAFPNQISGQCTGVYNPYVSDKAHRYYTTSITPPASVTGSWPNTIQMYLDAYVILLDGAHSGTVSGGNCYARLNFNEPISYKTGEYLFKMSHVSFGIGSSYTAYCLFIVIKSDGERQQVWSSLDDPELQVSGKTSKTVNRDNWGVIVPSDMDIVGIEIQATAWAEYASSQFDTSDFTVTGYISEIAGESMSGKAIDPNIRDHDG
ncbi:hypothetical protein [Clostridium sp. KNHs216]|uniref:hypothetical protein n=1 Tax=Clostridium sp. KNHs216 TaxID=1550235 RepID=UPI0011508433|nr:hypothetical protein [Clostridium sp. KNHs216]TQI66919.1 hypothetical protein LY85_1602 [Clostridium sp. KNHs216]